MCNFLDIIHSCYHIGFLNKSLSFYILKYIKQIKKYHHHDCAIFTHFLFITLNGTSSNMKAKPFSCERMPLDYLSPRYHKMQDLNEQTNYRMYVKYDKCINEIKLLNKYLIN